MNRKSKPIAILLATGLILIVMIAGCVTPGGEAPQGEGGPKPEQPDGGAFVPPPADAEAAPSPTIAQLSDAQSDGAEAEDTAAKSESEPEPTVSTTATLPATSVPVVKARASANLNLRRGPGTIYDIVGRLSAASEATVISRLDDNSWLLVKYESGEAWLTGDPDLVAIDSALLADLPIVDTPPLAYNPDNENVKRVLNQIPLVVYHDGFHTCASYGGLNNLFDVANGNVIGPHSGDFVMGNDNVLFEYSDGAVRLIQENSIARFEGGEKYLSFEQAMQLFTRDEIIWTGSFGEWPARGVTGCDPSASP